MPERRSGPSGRGPRPTSAAKPSSSRGERARPARDAAPRGPAQEARGSDRGPARGPRASADRRGARGSYAAADRGGAGGGARGAYASADRGPRFFAERRDEGRGPARDEGRGPARGDGPAAAPRPAPRRDDRGPREERRWESDRATRWDTRRSGDAPASRPSSRPAPRPADRASIRGRVPARGSDRGNDRGGAGQRRAFSMPSAPGRIGTGGDPALADRLGFALHVAGSDDLIVESLTHPFHSYPARTHPATARELVALVSEAMPARGLLVDPFCGSGTTLVEARAAGLRAIGVDINPLAVLVARAKTWTAPAKVRARLKSVGNAIAGEVLAAGKQARRASAEIAPKRGPKGFDPNSRNRRLAAWFAPHVRRELEDIAHHLDELAREDAEMAQVLTAALSAILYKVSSRTSDTNATWVQRNVARGASARWFQQRVELLCAGLDDLAKAPGQPPEIFEADMRSLGDIVAAGAAHGIVTSPPYAGTYDYADHQRLRFDFFGLRHRHLDQQEIGARRSLTGADAGTRWRSELGDAVDSIGTMLAPGALAALVIGDSIAAGRAFHALDDVRAVLTDELELVAWASQERTMLGAAERNAFGDRGKAEHLVLLRKRR